jgi:FAD:protein FMN transferase
MCSRAAKYLIQVFAHMKARLAFCTYGSLGRCLALLLALFCAPGANAAWHERVVDGIMGTRIGVELWVESGTDGEAAIDAVMDEMRRIDAAMSTYKPDSEVSRVNAQAARQPVHISNELFELLSHAVEFSRLTDGAFDITYASVGFMYDFRRHEKPSDEQIQRVLPAVNYRHLILDSKTRTVRFAQPAVRIDLGGIAKGHAVDRAIELLQRRGVQRAMVTAGGDSRIIGDRFGQPWVVGLRHPDRKNEVFQRIPLSDAAISTSGDYERFFDKDGVRYHHIIDPHSGHSASLVRSATIIGPNATTTDGLSKNAFVLGPERALELYNRLDGIDAILIKPDGQMLYTKGLEAPQ